MGLLPYSILLAKVLWIAAVAAQIFLTCTFRRWLIDQLDTHEISPVWLIPMVGNASPAFAGVDLGFPGLSKMLLFSALLCWALLCRLSSGVSCLFVLLPAEGHARPLLWFQRLRSSPSDCTVFMAV